MGISGILAAFTQFTGLTSRVGIAYKTQYYFSKWCTTNRHAIADTSDEEEQQEQESKILQCLNNFQNQLKGDDSVGHLICSQKVEKAVKGIIKFSIILFVNVGELLKKLDISLLEKPLSF